MESTEKMVIKSDRLAYGIMMCALIGILIVFIIEFGYQEIDLWMIILSRICLYYLIIVFGIVYGKKITLTPEGCTIGLFCFHKMYTWDQFKTKQWENYEKVLQGSRGFRGGLFLSTYRVRKHYHTNPVTYALFSFHPFSTIFIYFKVYGSDEKMIGNGKIHTGCYEADEQELRDTLSRWGVEIEEN